MDLLTNYSDINEVLYYNYFLKSEIKEYNVIAEKLEQKCKSGSYMSEGWSDITRDKMISIRNYIHNTKNECFLYSDVDVLFLQKTKDYLIKLLYDSDVDILFQSDLQEIDLSYIYNTGFFICKVNNITKKLFDYISNKTFEKNEDDQVVLNNIIKDFDIKVKCLSKLIYNYNFWRLDNIQYKDNINWSDDIFIKIPNDTLVFHANWTVGIDNKIKLLDMIRNQSDINRTL